jgi:hypothetical protein
VALQLPRSFPFSSREFPVPEPAARKLPGILGAGRFVCETWDGGADPQLTGALAAFPSSGASRAM